MLTDGNGSGTGGSNEIPGKWIFAKDPFGIVAAKRHRLEKIAFNMVEAKYRHDLEACQKKLTESEDLLHKEKCFSEYLANELMDSKRIIQDLENDIFVGEIKHSTHIEKLTKHCREHLHKLRHERNQINIKETAETEFDYFLGMESEIKNVLEKQNSGKELNLHEEYIRLTLDLDAEKSEKEMLKKEYLAKIASLEEENAELTATLVHHKCQNDNEPPKSMKIGETSKEQ